MENLTQQHQIQAQTETESGGSVSSTIHVCPDTHQPFLIKWFICPASSNMKEARTEIQFLKYLGPHPNLVQFIRADFAFQRAQLVFTSGQHTLLHHINTNGRMSEEQARPLFRQLLDVVGFLHKKGVVHTNLKAETILMTKDRQLLVSDLEHGRFWSEDRPFVQTCGSLHYACPEVFRGMEVEGPEVDIWALGVVLYGMVGGHLPWEGPTRMVATLVCGGLLPIPLHFSTDLTRFLQQILTPDRTQRLVRIPQLLQSSWLVGKSA